MERVVAGAQRARLLEQRAVPVPDERRDGFANSFWKFLSTLRKGIEVSDDAVDLRVELRVRPGELTRQRRQTGGAGELLHQVQPQGLAAGGGEEVSFELVGVVRGHRDADGFLEAGEERDLVETLHQRGAADAQGERDDGGGAGGEDGGTLGDLARVLGVLEVVRIGGGGRRRRR